MKKLSKVNKKKYGAGGPAAISYRGNTGITKDMANNYAYSAIRGVQNAEAAKQEEYDQMLSSMGNQLSSMSGVKYITGGAPCEEGFYRDFNTGRCVPIDPNQITPSNQLPTTVTAPTPTLGSSYFGRYDPTLQEKVMTSASNSLNNPTTTPAPTGQGVNPNVYGIAGTAAEYMLKKGTDDNNVATVTDAERFGNMSGSILGSAGKGAAMGAMLGPMGAAAGAVIGAGFGYFKGRKENKEAKSLAAQVKEDTIISGNLNREAMLANSMPNQTGFGYKSSTNMNMQPTNYFANAKLGGVRALEGGVAKPIAGSDAVKFEGRSHAQGGIKLDSTTEVEGGETMDKVVMKRNGGTSQDYFFSKFLKLGGRSFSKRHEEILKSNLSAVEKQNAMQDLAKMQESKAGRDPNQVAKLGGVRKYFTGGAECPEGQVWSEAEQRCVDIEPYMPLSSAPEKMQKEAQEDYDYWRAQFIKAGYDPSELNKNRFDHSTNTFYKPLGEYSGMEKNPYEGTELPPANPPKKYQIFQDNSTDEYILRDDSGKELKRSNDLNTVYQAKGRLVNNLPMDDNETTTNINTESNTITEPTKVESVADVIPPVGNQPTEDKIEHPFPVNFTAHDGAFSSLNVDSNDEFKNAGRDVHATYWPGQGYTVFEKGTNYYEFGLTAEQAKEKIEYLRANPQEKTESNQEESEDVSSPQGSADAQSNADAVDVTLRDENKANSNAPSDQEVITEGSESNSSGLNSMEEDRAKRDNEPVYFMGAKRKIDDLGNVTLGNQLLQGHGKLIGSGLGSTTEGLADRQKNIIGTAVERKQENDYVNKNVKEGELPSSDAIKDREKIAETDWGKYFGYKPGMSAKEATEAHTNYANKANELFTNNSDLVLSYFQYMIDNAASGSEAETIKANLKKKGYTTTDASGRIVIDAKALPYLQQQATNNAVGPIHNSMAYLASTDGGDVIPVPTYVPPDKPKEEPKEEPTYTPSPECPPNTYKNPTTGRCEPLSAFSAQKNYAGLIPQLAQLVPVGYSLLNPYQIKPGVGAVGSTARAILPRVNYNQERASLINQNVALRNAVTNQNAGPGSIAALMAAGNQASENQLKIAQAESEANKGLAAEEAKMNLQASLSNQELALKRDMFNKEYYDKQRNYKREEILGALDAAAQRTAGIYKDNRLMESQERLAKALDETGSYDRYTIFEELKRQSKSEDSPYYGKTDVELRAMAAAYAKSIYGDLQYYKYLADKEGSSNKDKDKDKESAKLGGARKYTSRLGELSTGRKRFNI